MTKFVDYICENVALIAKNKFESNENSVQDNFQNTLNDISKFMEKVIQDIKQQLKWYVNPHLL